MSDEVIFMPIKLNSKRVIDKNLQKICGKPLICWTIEKIVKLGIPVYIYTSWVDEIKTLIDTQYKNGFTNLEILNRPDALNTDTTKGIDIYKAFANQINANVYMLVHCTSPFVKIDTYKRVLNAIIDENYDSAYTVQSFQTFVHYNNAPLNFNGPRPRTQEIEPVYIETSGVYCFKDWILQTGNRSGGKETQIVVDHIEAIDIDTNDDLDFAKVVGNYVNGISTNQ